MPRQRRLGRTPFFAIGLALFALLLTPLGQTALARPAAGGKETAGERVDLDVLFIGAHPDDEASGLSTYGQWNEYDGIRAGVITITRGEGGGNAVGTEEGPALGLLREAEERRAVAKAGIQHIYNLDDVDFYYTVSSPLTEQIWGSRDTLEKVVRVVRATRPDVIITMNPSPTPGNHGNHQYAARLAVEAFYAAADPAAFAGQIQQEGLPAWRAKKLFRSGASFAADPPNGPTCESTFTPVDPTDNIFNIWSGRQSNRFGKTWAQVEREAQREYVSQGWGVFPDVPADPNMLACDRFTLIDSRVPFSAANTSPTAMLEGALRPAAGGLPLGTEFYLATDRFDVAPGQQFRVTAYARNGGRAALPAANVVLNLPAGWTATGAGTLGTLPPNQERTASFTVTAPPNAATNTRIALKATLRVGGLTGETNRAVQVVPLVRGTLEPLPQVAQFRAWADQVDVPQLDSLIKPVLSLGTGENRPVRVDLRNVDAAAHSGSVSLTLPPGFVADPAANNYGPLAPQATGSTTFSVRNTDPNLLTSNQGGVPGVPGVPGDYDFTITTTSERGSGSQTAALNLVPVTSIPRASSVPVLDGKESMGEYTGASLNLSRRWEGQDPTSPADASGTAKLTWFDDALYIVVNVVDDVLGTVLTPDDAKRHWRTDSVEIAIDPRANSENTSTTFKVGIFPTTADSANGNPPAAYRDADAHQGPIAATAPGMQVRAALAAPYTGYTIETRIPFAVLPAAADPGRIGLNIFIYDSDTQNKTGQTRLGWSTWGGVQGDPYRWGHASLPDYTPPAGQPTTPREPIIPTDKARSVLSPQSILQAATDGVALAGEPAARPNNSVRIAAGPTLAGSTLSVELQATGAGTAHVFAWTGTTSVAHRSVNLGNGQAETLTWQLGAAERAALAAGGRLLVAFEAAAGGTTSLAAPIAVAAAP